MEGLLDQRITDGRIAACAEFGCARRACGSPQDVPDLCGVCQRMQISGCCGVGSRACCVLSRFINDLLGCPSVVDDCETPASQICQSVSHGLQPLG